MIKMHELREIIKLLDQSSIREFELESEGTKISIKKEKLKGAHTTGEPSAEPVAVPTPHVVQTPAALPVQERTLERVEPVQEAKAAAPAANQDESLHKIVSPMVGTFYSKPDPSASSFVKAGDKIKPDSIVCIVEAMKLFNEIEAEVSGEIVKILVTEGQLVEYGQPLFLVKPE
jgi:acetyl-CoA carboxylase biotin carboxyl carrier protein